MSYTQEQFDLSIRIEGRELDLQKNFFHSIKMVESAISALPSIQIAFYGVPEDIDDIGIGDGTKIEVSIRYLNSPEDTDYWIPFRVFSVKSNPVVGGDVLLLYSYYDAPKYLFDAGFNVISGTSGNVVRRLANLSGLTSNVDSSSDSMTWIQGGKSAYLFLLDVTRHAFLNRSSAFVNCVSRTGELRFFNIGERRSNDSQWEFISTDNSSITLGDNQLIVDDYTYNIRSGILNKWSGYGKLYNEFNLMDGKVVPPESLSMKLLDKSTDTLEINPEVLSPPKYNPLPFNVGNTHSNYSRSKIQNERILSTFSTSVMVSTRRIKEVNLLDRVSVNLSKNAPSYERGNLDGQYFVSHIVSKITTDNLEFHFELIREGSNETNLLSPKL